MTPLLPFAAAFALGWVATAPCLPRAGRYAPLALGAGIGVGMGLASIVQLAWLHAPGAPLASWPAELALLAMLAAAGAKTRREASAPVAAAPRTQVRTALVLVAAIVWVAAAAVAAAAFAETAYLAPHGTSGDAWMLWNARARLLFRSGADWATTFDIAQGDHPLLLPLFVVSRWHWLGHDVTAAPVGAAAAFTFATLLVLTGAVAALRTTTLGLLAGCVLLGSAGFFGAGATQLADVPLAFFVLTALVLAAVAARAPPAQAWRARALAGFAAGCAAWTKTEGILLPLALGASTAAVALWRAGFRGARRELAPLAAGAAPGLLALLLFRLRYAPPLDLMPDGTSLLEKIADPERWATIARAGAEALVHLGPWGPPVLLGCLLLLRIRPAGQDRAALAVLAATLALQVCGYVAAYVVTPLPLQWQLDFSIHRVVLHLWPAAIFVGFLAARAPEEALAGRSRAAAAGAA